jgi:hypothetical protein
VKAAPNSFERWSMPGLYPTCKMRGSAMLSLAVLVGTMCLHTVRSHRRSYLPSKPCGDPLPETSDAPPDKPQQRQWNEDEPPSRAP